MKDKPSIEAFNHEDNRSRGFVIIQRNIDQHWIMDNAEYFKAWFLIISQVNFKDKKVAIKGQLIECKRAQSLNSLQTWANLFGVKNWSIQKVRTFFKLLQNDKMITLENVSKTTRLTVCNYDTYQNVKQVNNTQTTRKQHANNRQLTTNNNVNQDNNGNNDNNSINDGFVKIQSWIKELPESDYLRGFAEQLSTEVSILKGLIPDFVKAASPHYDNHIAFLKHFKNWAAIQIKNRSQVPSELKTTVSFGTKKQ